MRILLIAALLGLGGCGEACRTCLASSPRNPVATAELEKIRLFDGERLPGSARDVYYHEECSVDCTYWLRFTVPDADARSFAARFHARPRKGYDPMPESGGGNEGPGFAWWPDKFPDGFEGDEVERDAARTSALVIARDDKGNATVWVTESNK
ncbi:hypothetical protein TPR58_04165 [Sphingomonas sp. HF-S3]|uniref:Lipoprotein n=1 Tax=Sphingomonas rustica TaxID=3103142 RepID=A0ABV0B745_9SPHN